MNVRFGLAVVLPFLALALQWMLWHWISPFVWFLFFPAVFFSARLAGFWGGLASTALSIVIVWFFFIPPQLSWAIGNPSNVYAAGMFLVMGYLFSDAQERLLRAQRKIEATLVETWAAHEKITQLYKKTLELDELKTQFFANVSHELRTPLALILGPVRKLLAARNPGNGDRRDLEVVDRNARLLYRHVSDLLDVAKLEAGRMVVRYAEIDLAHLVRFVASHFENLANDRHLHYTIHSPDAFPAQLDAEKCQRTLINLLSNAFKFTPDGGEISVTLGMDGDRALISVQDSGPGIPESLRESIFERFRQGDGGATRHYAGIGLGLAIVEEFVKLQGGGVEVADAPGGGALFTVTLPLAAPAGAAIYQTPSAMDEWMDLQASDASYRGDTVPRSWQLGAPQNSPLVLVVEDNRDMNAFIADTLSAHYRVISAFDGREGLNKALETRPDLIVSDVMMPGMSGEQMVEAMRQHHELDDIPVVILSAKADDDLRVRLLREGAQDFIDKPFVAGELLARVERTIAERRQAAQQLWKSEERFRETFEQAAVGLAHVALDGRWLRVNEKLCSILGYSREELLQLTFLDITQPDDLDVTLDYRRQMLSGAIQTFAREKQYIRRDGQLVWINLTVSLVRDEKGEPDYFIAVIEDIQRRKRVEQNLRESEAQYRGVIETTSDGFWMVSPDGKLIEVNNSYVRRSGYSREELLDMRVNDLDVEESPEETSLRMEKMRSDGHDRFESQHRAKDGSVWPVEIVASFLPLAGGKHFAFFRDLSERKQAELERHELHTELEQLLQLHVARQTAIALAHDLNQPLLGISAYSEAALLMLEAGNPNPEKLAHALQAGAKASQQAGAAVRQLLSFLHKAETTGEKLDLNKLVQESLAVVHADGFGIASVTLDFAPDLPPVYANRLQVQNVISNLLRNSEEAMGDVKEGAAIIIGTSSTEGEARVTMHDNGPGLSEDLAARSFDPFFTTKPTGIGMGLAISRTLIEANGGRLWHEPTAAGASFHFTLPFAQ
ncbi:MAG: PAS domain S-box protein [Sulfuricella sp.]